MLAEPTRAAATLTVFTDGLKTASAKAAFPTDKDASLSNGADFLVGKGPSGSFFSGALEFLRVTRSSLAEPVRATIDRGALRLGARRARS